VAEKQLRRSSTDRRIAGVAAGVAEYFDLDPTLVRVAWVVAVIFGGFGFLLYIILWMVVPVGPPASSAVAIAEERYARGEITAEELARIREDLEGAR